MLGGLLCERRHSEATPAMKPKLSLAVPIARPCSAANEGTHPGSVPLPLLLRMPHQDSAPIVLKQQPHEGVESEFEEEHSGHCMRIGCGKYEFWDKPIALLGRGSYGVVFRGLRLPQRQPVAIKRMWRVNVRPQELEAMKCVRNECLVALLDVCEEPREPVSYLVMELCDNDLDKHLRAMPNTKLGNSPDMRVVAESMAHGYFALFQKHIVHRDIKPQNVLLLYGPDGLSIRLAKITDFGVSRVLADENMGLCNVAGTLLYMAPEVGANLVAISEYDHSADMWSIGCLLYQCLVGCTPFDEASLCRLFLYCAGANFDGYEQPEMPADAEASEYAPLIRALLQIERTKRATPRQLMEATSMEYWR